MTWRGWVVCAAWALAGCASMHGPRPAADAQTGEWHALTLQGSPAAVAPTAQSVLSGMGLLVHSDQQKDAIRLRGQTTSGKRFALLLVRGRAKQESAQGPGEVTHVRLVWEKDAEAGFWGRVQAALRETHTLAR